MEKYYKHTFDQVQMPEDKATAIRSMISSRSIQTIQEDHSMKNKPIVRRFSFALVAIILVCSLSVTAFAHGEKIVEAIYQFITGGFTEKGIDEKGNAYSGGSMDMNTITAPMEIREDGKVYLTINGENKDITNEFSYTTPYIYECVGNDGLRHVFVIGGNLDAIGWSEFLWDDNGLPSAGQSMFGTPNGSDDAPWLDAAIEELGLPW